MNIAAEIDTLFDEIDRELSLLDRLTVQMSCDLDTRGTQDMARLLSSWELFQDLE